MTREEEKVAYLKALCFGNWTDDPYKAACYRAFDDIKDTLRGIDNVQEKRLQEIRNVVTEIIRKEVQLKTKQGTETAQQEVAPAEKPQTETTEVATPPKRGGGILRTTNVGANGVYDKRYKSLLQQMQTEWRTLIATDFTLGQAQKWLNMTLQYLYALGLFGGIVNLFHVPIDRYIMEAAEIQLESRVDKSFNSWITLDNYDTYQKYQYQLRNCVYSKFGVSAFIWGFGEWIKHLQKQ